MGTPYDAVLGFNQSRLHSDNSLLSDGEAITFLMYVLGWHIHDLSMEKTEGTQGKYEAVSNLLIEAARRRGTE